MKKFLLLMGVIFFSAHLLFAQAKPKPKKKDVPPTQKEMDEMIKEAQKEINGMSAEDKRMMDSMGIKMPSMTNIPKVSDKDLAKAWEDDARLVPKKDISRLASIPPTPTTTELPAFITKVNIAAAAVIPADVKADGAAVYQSIKQNNSVSAGNGAISFWLLGQPLLALDIMGRSCMDEPGNIDNINNYAAMLTMTGAEQAAIPILQNLNRRFPGNSTILNNLGQAWFGLGDIDKASHYLDSAILIYSYHPQANYTKSLIEERQGHEAEAIEAMKRSIYKSFTADKENRLKKLGKKLTGKDIDFPFPMPQDPMGLEKFTWPAYPNTVWESITLEKEWSKFYEKCDAEISALKTKSAQLEQIAIDALGKRTKAIVQSANGGKYFNPMPLYAPMAILKLSYLVDDKDGGMEHRLQVNAREWEKVNLNIDQLGKAKSEKEKLLDEKYDPLIGEGRPNPLKEYCNSVNEVRNQYLLAANGQVQMLMKSIIEDQRKFLNNQVYYSQYINWPEDFEVIKVNAKISWLTTIRNQGPRFESIGPHCVLDEKDKPKGKNELQAFDDVACQYHSSFDFGIMDYKSDCSKFEGNLKLGFAKYSRRIDSDDHDRLLAASLEIGVSAGKSWEKGPVKAEGKAEIKGKLEWNEHEVTNWEVTSEIGLSAGSNLGHGDKSIDIAGIKAQIGMNSGSSVSGKLLMQNFNISRK